MKLMIKVQVHCCEQSISNEGDFEIDTEKKPIIIDIDSGSACLSYAHDSS